MKTMLRRWCCASSIVLATMACSSSSEPGSIEQDASSTPTDAAVDASDSMTHVHDTAPPSDVPAEVAPDSKVANDASAECTKFCACMSANCATKKFATDCLFDCAAQTRWDLPCRANMCSLVPAQPDNDHCTHAMGVDQCLDH